MRRKPRRRLLLAALTREAYAFVAPPRLRHRRLLRIVAALARYTDADLVSKPPRSET